jgi:hypothetical protein
MRIYVQYQDRGDITLVWTEEDDSQGHVFDVPRPGYYQAEVEVPAQAASGETTMLATLPACFRVSHQNGRAVLVAK